LLSGAQQKSDHMPESVTAGPLPIDDALSFAMILAWDDFAEVAVPRAVRVEYLGEPGIPLDQLTVWLVTSGGYQERICDYRAPSLSEHSREWRCWTRLRSAKLVGAVDFIMRNQERFLRRADASPQGLIVVFAPTREQSAEAVAWMAGNGIATLPAAPPRARAASFAEAW
jgi:hypothetical protein